ncbi:hypothetical protein KC19_6G202700 [Ceratodon purpureus]|uniref:Uncharacterized protein n=1 Tax=Ceratodon purpureus TaxID=3225 RepID=A0A8T0HJL6_CERPU|nr:hypothetical protein KC19_6G202700 [Ceratodon purpureus]
MRACLMRMRGFRKGTYTRKIFLEIAVTSELYCHNRPGCGDQVQYCFYRVQKTKGLGGDFATWLADIGFITSIQLLESKFMLSVKWERHPRISRMMILKTLSKR